MTEQTPKKLIAFTFDDGPNTTITPLVLDLLEKYNCTATFFLVGNNINEESAKVVKRARKLGCEIANHSFSHSALPELSANEIMAEIDKTSDLIQKITGEKPAFFRAPYIATNDLMFDIIPMPFICGHGVDDWDEKISATSRISGISDMACDGRIVLLHDMEGNYATVEALKVLLPSLLEQNYEFVTVSQLFERKHKSPTADEFKRQNISDVK
ncbi:MAG: polysaccharide deacetylase family protein [Agathobacter sp.]